MNFAKNLTSGEKYYTMTERGVIRNRNFAKQLRNFSGLVYDSISPTDIDGCIEYKNKLFVFVESKFNGAKMPFGQRLAFERLNDAIERSGKPSLFLVAKHESDDDIDVANSIVTEYRQNYHWHFPKKEITVKEASDIFIEKILGRER